MGFSFRIHPDTDHLSPCITTILIQNLWVPTPLKALLASARAPPPATAYSLPGLQEMYKYIRSRWCPSSSQLSRGFSLLCFIRTPYCGLQALHDTDPATAPTLLPAALCALPQAQSPSPCRPPARTLASQGLHYSGYCLAHSLRPPERLPSHAPPWRGAPATLSTAAHVLLILLYPFILLALSSLEKMSAYCLLPPSQDKVHGERGFGYFVLSYSFITLNILTEHTNT